MTITEVTLKLPYVSDNSKANRIDTTLTGSTHIDNLTVNNTLSGNVLSISGSTSLASLSISSNSQSLGYFQVIGDNNYITTGGSGGYINTTGTNSDISTLGVNSNIHTLHGSIYTSDNTTETVTAAAGFIDETGNNINTRYALKDNTNLTGIPTAPTAASGTNTTQIATTEFVQSSVSSLVNSAPETLNTLNELATALGNDPNFATTVSTQLGLKANKTDASLIGTTTAENLTVTGTLTGTLTGNAATATKATQDASGNVITDTYATKSLLDTKASDSAVVHTSNTETVSGTKTFTSTIVGDVTGNAGTCKVRFINLVNNNDDLARVMNFTPPSLADVFNSWYRFSHENNYVQYNSSNAVGNALLDIEAWVYDSENNVIKNTRNTATYVGFVSPDLYNKFTIKTEIGSLTSNDDDALSIVIAFMRDVNGIEHHISVVRDGWSNGERYNKFNLVYDYQYTGFGSAKALLASGEDLITIQSGWQNHTALIYAERDGNKRGEKGTI